MIDFVEFKLGNGLQCILHRDTLKPIVNITVGYKVGSRDETPGKRGVAHLFEHLMFQGSKNIKKGKHFDFVQQAGGSCNAFTNQDLTVYYENLPSNHLATGLWLEADRMNEIDLSEENLSNQKNVVIQEKLQNYDNAPYGMALINILKILYENSSYETATIGYENDINSFLKSEAEDFHYNFYSPHNSSIIISGDIDYSETLHLVENYFGKINKSTSIKRNFNPPKDFKENRRLKIFDNIKLPVLYFCYPIPEVGSKEDYTFEYFANIIANDRSSRLYKNLVYERKLVKSVNAIKYQFQNAGIFIISVVAFPDSELDYIENEIVNEIDDFVRNGIKNGEYNKIKNKLEYGFNAKLTSLQNISLELFSNWFFFNDAGRVNDNLKRYLSVSKDDVVSSVRQYLFSTPKLLLTYLPKN
ncbi:MAG: pitrilysin family protein [Ignavibacteria bacterium]|jgi:predicted Zn-dependent peptidase